MDWQQDLDALIESTMAFAKDVKPRSSSDLTRVVRTAERALAESRTLETTPSRPMEHACSYRRFPRCDCVAKIRRRAG
jgi:hypothetical protein